MQEQDDIAIPAMAREESRSKDSIKLTDFTLDPVYEHAVAQESERNHMCQRYDSTLSLDLSLPFEHISTNNKSDFSEYISAISMDLSAADLDCSSVDRLATPPCRPKRQVTMEPSFGKGIVPRGPITNVSEFLSELDLDCSGERQEEPPPCRPRREVTMETPLRDEPPPCRPTRQVTIMEPSKGNGVVTNRPIHKLSKEMTSGGNGLRPCQPERNNALPSCQPKMLVESPRRPNRKSSIGPCPLLSVTKNVQLGNPTQQDGASPQLRNDQAETLPDAPMLPKGHRSTGTNGKFSIPAAAFQVPRGKPQMLQGDSTRRRFSLPSRQRPLFLRRPALLNKDTRIESAVSAPEPHCKQTLSQEDLTCSTASESFYEPTFPSRHTRALSDCVSNRSFSGCSHDGSFEISHILRQLTASNSLDEYGVSCLTSSFGNTDSDMNACADDALTGDEKRKSFFSISKVEDFSSLENEI